MRLMDEFIGRDVTLGRFDGDGEEGVCQGRPGIWRDGGKIGRVCVVSEESVGSNKDPKAFARVSQGLRRLGDVPRLGQRGAPADQRRGLSCSVP